MILGEAFEEGLLGANPCRKLRTNTGHQPERPHASPEEVATLATRVSLDNAVLIITATYTGMRWGELAGLQWDHTNLHDGEIVVHPLVGALHEIRGRLELGPPKHRPASAPSTYRRFTSSYSPSYAAATPTPGSCSPAPTVGCTAVPTSAAESGSPP
jgi:integrase